MSVRNACDQLDEAIRAVRQGLSRMTRAVAAPTSMQRFGDGDFALPMIVHDRDDVPGTAGMASRKDRIQYRYADTPQGGRVDIVTTDPAALEAVHQFLAFQIRDHGTGDSLAPGRR